MIVLDEKAPSMALARTDRPSRMNKGEARYAQHLELLRLAGEIVRWDFEDVTLRLADKTRYTPDFMVLLPNREVEFHEFKGFWRDDARVKIKVAAERFAMFRFVAVQEIPKKDGGGYLREDFR